MPSDTDALISRIESLGLTNRCLDVAADVRAAFYRLTAERDAERLRYGQQCARNTEFLLAFVALARRGPEFQAIAQDAVKKADAAAAQVRLEDFTTAALTPPPKDKP